jgi:hypothetical protein
MLDVGSWTFDVHSVPLFILHPYFSVLLQHLQQLPIQLLPVPILIFDILPAGIQDPEITPEIP